MTDLKGADRASSSPSAPRNARASSPPTPPTSTAAVESLAEVLPGPALIVGKSTVPVGTAARLAERLARPRPTSRWRGTPSSCARATPSRTLCAPTGWSSGSPPTAPRRCCGGLRPSDRRRHPGRRHRPGHRRAGQGRRELVPRHEDLVHQRDGRGARRPGPTSDPRRRASATTTASAASSSTPASGSAAGACPRTSARSWPAPASWAPTRR